MEPFLEILIETSDPFADLDREEGDSTLSSLDDLLSHIHSDVTVKRYMNNEEDLPTCLTFDGDDDVNFHLALNSAVEEGYLPKRLELDAEEDESSDEEVLQCSSIHSFDVAVTLIKYLLLFL